MLRDQPYYQPREDTYMKLIVLLGKSGQPHRAHQLFKSIHEDGCESTELYTALIAAYCQNKLVDEVFSILDEMRNLPCCQPDIFTYSTLIKALVEALQFEMVELLYDEMAKRSIMPNTLTQNIVVSGYVISACAKEDALMEMERFFNRMKEKECQPDNTTYSVMIEAYRKESMNDKIHYLEQEKQTMISDDKKLNEPEETIG
uniref:Uncharacterized protein n=1 Tax=Cajanus cajan TaxID=3821 RepID=A0A151RY11_CAJCA|nr:hypothetical protein KK1_030944 [Cajanus cajan]